MSLPIRLALALTAVSAKATPWPAHAWRFSDDLEVYGYLQGWLTLYEQMEDANEDGRKDYRYAGVSG